MYLVDIDRESHKYSVVPYDERTKPNPFHTEHDKESTHTSKPDANVVLSNRRGYAHGKEKGSFTVTPPPPTVQSTRAPVAPSHVPVVQTSITPAVQVTTAPSKTPAEHSPPSVLPHNKPTPAQLPQDRVTQLPHAPPSSDDLAPPSHTDLPSQTPDKESLTLEYFKKLEPIEQLKRMTAKGFKIAWSEPPYTLEKVQQLQAWTAKKPLYNKYYKVYCESAAKSPTVTSPRAGITSARKKKEDAVQQQLLDEVRRRVGIADPDEQSAESDGSWASSSRSSSP